MIDTIRLVSPPLEEGVSLIVGAKLDYMTRVNRESGEMVYAVTAGQIEGSYEHCISIRIDEMTYVLTVEGSVHKMMLGHNVFGGPLDVRASCRFMVARISQLLGVQLPDADGWIVRRIDWAETFLCASEFQAIQFLRRLESVRFPKRRVDVYKDESVYIPGKNTTSKIYHKGKEFRKHDRKRLMDSELSDEIEELQARADRTLRFEVEMRSEHLRRMNGDETVLVGSVGKLDFEGYVSSVAYRLMREHKEGMDTVRTSQEVVERLKAIYGGRRAMVLHGIWASFAIGQEEMLKESLKKATFYRYRKMLVDAGISWIGTDVVVDPEGVLPFDFSLDFASGYRESEEHPRVRELLAEFL